ncbi:uncharacterized protein C8A04DRAFT_9142 [Dichotomopilus funicola]|uniref:Nucleoside 2-deoxyribosyltransferase-like protein n=1 Tax=Dichotomopilus funicola TaxID=1934379 RepID=A0AAN6ZQP0_9PEZI|nr:hypothetical protein C8A04DRAFT_9142 [Dichotomopilus funicola]
MVTTVRKPLPTPPKAQVIPAPGRAPTTGKLSVFLAGSITASSAGPDWRLPLIESLRGHQLTLFNPLREDWNASWREDMSFGPFREQVDWEQDMQERADVLVVYFGAMTDAPISLLELGLSARSPTKKIIVVCHNLYPKLGYVEIVSRRLGLDFFKVGNEKDLLWGVQERLLKLLRARLPRRAPPGQQSQQSA